MRSNKKILKLGKQITDYKYKWVPEWAKKKLDLSKSSFKNYKLYFDLHPILELTVDDLKIGKKSKNRKKRARIQHFDIGWPIGDGYSSIVYLARYKNIYVAIKVIYKKFINLEYLLNEVHNMKLVNNQKCIELYDFFHDKKRAYIIMEYAPNGSLAKLIEKNEKLSENVARIIFRRILDIIADCHALNIVHRDIKPHNFLIDKNKNLKLADFGFSTCCLFNFYMDRGCGSPYYVAPEVLSQNYTKSVDIWSAVVVLYEMVNGITPFYAESDNVLYKNIISLKYQKIDENSENLNDLFEKIFVPENKRLNIEQIYQHKWVKI